MAKWSRAPKIIQKNVVLKCREVVQVAYYLFVTRLVVATPRLTGQLRNNWRTSLNAPSMIIVWGPSESASESYASAKRAMDAYVLGDTITLRNRLPYARKIEYEGWSRVKAPQGMLRITVAQWPQIKQQAIKAVKSNGVIE